MISQILEDERPIGRLDFGPGDFWIGIGYNGVTKIVAYGEPGEYCPIPWFAIMEGNDIKMRVPATQVMVTYQTVGGN